MELGSGGMGMGGCGNVCRRWSVAERVDDGAGARGGRRWEEDQRAGRGRGGWESAGGGEGAGLGGRAGGLVMVVPVRGGPHGHRKVLSASSNEARLCVNLLVYGVMVYQLQVIKQEQNI